MTFGWNWGLRWGGIRDWDWELGLGIGIRDWGRIWDWDWRLGLGLEVGIGEWGWD